MGHFSVEIIRLPGQLSVEINTLPIESDRWCLSRLMALLLPDPHGPLSAITTPLGERMLLTERASDRTKPSIPNMSCSGVLIGRSP